MLRLIRSAMEDIQMDDNCLQPEAKIALQVDSGDLDRDRPDAEKDQPDSAAKIYTTTPPP